ncbi:hypothetical protein NDU88_001000 [Pleurodeles waltl]|uniref:Uncharacterized protein n=1 Tax=Pleurodeles waltl TaxID=8319 RepID=A0AAV7L8H2_PLEWA|nr:hypothetical protein NDU88_001000 [Pleurodeles waltl]
MSASPSHQTAHKLPERQVRRQETETRALQLSPGVCLSGHLRTNRRACLSRPFMRTRDDVMRLRVVSGRDVWEGAADLVRDVREPRAVTVSVAGAMRA